jgi:hypothetical protein
MTKIHLGNPLKRRDKWECLYLELVQEVLLEEMHRQEERCSYLNLRNSSHQLIISKSRQRV